MESTLFTELTASEQATVSGGASFGFAASATSATGALSFGGSDGVTPLASTVTYTVTPVGTAAVLTPNTTVK